MALQQINWLQIDTANVPSGSLVDLGAISNSLHAVYADNLFISGQTLEDIILNSGISELNIYSASLKDALETSGSNLTVKGNLTVLGTTTAIQSNIITLGDNIVELNGTGGAYGGLLIKDPTSPNTISGSLLWDTANDKWIAGPLGSETPIILEQDLTNYSSSAANLFNEIGIWRETGSFYATTHDLQMTGSVIIKGDLIVEGKTTLIQKLDPNVESLVVSGAMSIVENQINEQVIKAALTIQNLGTIADRSNNSIIDCGDGFF